MRAETKTVGNDTKFLVEPGYQVRFVPGDNKAAYPLLVRLNNEVGKVLVVASDMPLCFAEPWRQLEAYGQAVGAVWRVEVAEGPGDNLGAASTNWAQPVRMFRKVLAAGAELAADDTYSLERLTSGSSPFDDPFDVRRARTVLLKLSHGEIAGGAGTPTCTLALNLIDNMRVAGDDEQVNPLGCEQLTAVLNNAPTAPHPDGNPGTVAYASFGEGLPTYAASTARTRGLRWPWVTCTLKVENTTADPVVFTHGLIAELWVFP